MVRFEENFSLKQLNTFGIAASCRYYFEFTEEEDLPAFLSSFEQWKGMSLLIFGDGSNLLFLSDFEGLILKPDLPGIRVIREDRDHVCIEAGAGEEWDNLVSYCVACEYCGLENLSLIPGKVGAAPVQNIGAYGVEAKDCILSVKGFDLTTFRFYEISGSECGFGYRDSLFKHQLKGRFIVTSVVFRLLKFPQFHLDYGGLRKEVEKRGPVTLQNIRNAVISIRKSKLPDPGILGNAGSFFKNPVVGTEVGEKLKEKFPQLSLYPLENGKVKIAAGWLIEQCGWKGFRDADAGVHEKQALVLVNYGMATGKQIYELSEKIKKSVYERFSVKLEREVNII